jgi:hypothetical protein
LSNWIRHRNLKPIRTTTLSCGALKCEQLLLGQTVHGPKEVLQQPEEPVETRLQAVALRPPDSQESRLERALIEKTAVGEVEPEDAERTKHDSRKKQDCILLHIAESIKPDLELLDHFHLWPSLAKRVKKENN